MYGQVEPAGHMRSLYIGKPMAFESVERTIGHIETMMTMPRKSPTTWIGRSALKNDVDWIVAVQASQSPAQSVIEYDQTPMVEK